MLSILVEKKGCSVNYVDNKGKTALYHAVSGSMESLTKVQVGGTPVILRN